MFPDYNDNAFQTTLNSLNASSTITIDYIDQEIKLTKDSFSEIKQTTQKLISELKNTEDIHVHPNIIFYLFLVLFIISFAENSALYYKFIHPIARKRKFDPINSTEIELDIVKKTEKSLYPSVNTINA